MNNVFFYKKKSKEPKYDISTTVCCLLCEVGE